MRAPSKENVLRAQRKLNRPIFGGRDWDVTMGGIRTNIGGPTGQSRQSDLFDDWIWMRWEEHGREQFLIVPATTDPGLKILQRPIASAGTAIMVPDFYPRLWKKGRHSKIQNAFRQNAPVKVYRDRDRDHYLDMGPNVPIQEGIFWINCHPASYSTGGSALRVGGWSAGCQVTQKWDDFAKLRAVRDMQEKKHGTSVTSYSLMTILDL